MGNHPNYVVGYNGTLNELAEAIGNMSYDETSRFIGLLADDLAKQAEGDRSKGRVKLADRMNVVVGSLRTAKTDMDLAWKICEPHTEKVEK